MATNAKTDNAYARGDEANRHFPSLYDEVTEVSYMGVLVSGLAALRRLAREGETTGDDILTLPYTGEQLKEFWQVNKQQIHGKMREKDHQALASILEGEDLLIDRILAQGALHHMGDDKAMEECVYCITTNPARQRIVVTFRGSITVQDWLQDSKMLMGELPNPLAGQDDDQPETVGVHAGFRDYLYHNAPSILSTTVGNVVHATTDAVGTVVHTTLDAVGDVVHTTTDATKLVSNSLHRAAKSTTRAVKSAGSSPVDKTPPESKKDNSKKSEAVEEEMALSSMDKPAFTNSISSNISKKSSEIVGASKKVISSSLTSVSNALPGKNKEGEQEEKQSKVALIMGKVQAMLEELDDYSVYIAGHSLGGALSLIFAMEAAVQLKTPYPVTVFALGNPRTGNLDFRHVICSLEEKRLLRCVCIHNQGDFVPQLPELVSTCCYLCVCRREGTLRHVGIKMKISHKDMSIRYHNRDNESFRNDMMRQGNNIWGTLASVVNIKYCCSPSKSHSVARHYYEEYVLRLQKLEKQLKDIYLDDLYEKAYDPTS